MDHYFKPVLLSSLIVILFNTLIIVPIISSPIVTYFLGGVIAVIIFLGQFKKREGEEVICTRTITTSDVIYLGVGTGLFAGCILALLFAFKMQDEEFKRQLIETINEATRLKSGGDLRAIEELSPMFITITSIITIFLCSALSFLGGLATLPFLSNKKK